VSVVFVRFGGRLGNAGWSEQAFSTGCWGQQGKLILIQVESERMFEKMRFVEFSEKNTQSVFEYRNDLRVRKYMASPMEITYLNHCRWVQDNILTRKNVLIFLVWGDEVPLGFVSLKFLEGKSAEVGIILPEAEKYIGAGAICSVLIGEIAFEELGVERLYMKALRDNSHAISNIVKLGGLEVDNANGAERMFFLSREKRYERSPFSEGISKKFRPILQVEWNKDPACWQRK